MLRQLAEQDRPATAAEQAVLARWSAWGASGLSAVFDEAREEFADQRRALAGLLTPAEWAAARRTAINAHYTDATLVQDLWSLLGELGFSSGRVLEPGCGSGHFIGFAPAGAAMTGVELDPTTARIAAALYPDATIRAESFADTKLPRGYFDAMIGNVPFADVRLHDPAFNAGRHSIHNHFLIKSLELTRPGGLVVALTSRWTLDAQDDAARRDLAGLADLVGAVRLWTGALAGSAGTDAVGDLLVLRRREPGVRPAEDQRWLTTIPLPLVGPSGEEELQPVNRYFVADHPRRVLGDFALRIGLYGVAGLEVDPPAREERLPRWRAALADVVDEARTRGLLGRPRTGADPWASGTRFAAATELDGQLIAADARFVVVEEGVHQPLRIPATQQAELTRLLELRDLARQLLAAEAATGDDTAELDRLRGQLNRSWQRYRDSYGPIDRYTLRRTGREDDDGEPTSARIMPAAVRTLMRDPSGPLVAALEVFDEETQVAEPAGLLRGRQIVPRQPVARVQAVEDALAVCLDQHGRIDWPVIGDLLDVAPDQAAAALLAQGLVFEVPGADPPAWETRTGYLSGNVRKKLAQARLAAVEDPERWQRNLNALRAVAPPELGPDSITVRVGAVWIPPQDYTDFLREISGDRYARVLHYGGGSWEVEGAQWGIAARHEWGTDDLPAGPLLGKLLAQQRIEVFVTDAEDRRVLHPTRTEAAKERAHLIQDRFASWVWAEPERAARLAGEYNRLFNSIVLRDYTGEGAHLSLPGLSPTFTPRPHQRAAVARIINEPNTGLFHAVGAGKTAEMVMGVMELRRLGLAHKPAVVVPNHMLEQFTREWQQLYPQAKLLAAYPDDVTAQRRRRFVGRVATNDWDAVVMTRTTFQRLSLSPANQAAYIDRELALVRDQLAAAESGGVRSSRTLKQLEKTMLRREQQLKELLDTPVDPGITFEASGIDLLVVDELHDYKNLATTSNIRDAAITGSQRATDLHMKIDYLRHHHGGRAIIAATATPIANSVTEMWVLQRYLDPDTLTDAGLRTFDQWAATFGEVVSELELSVTGGNHFKVRDRFARFGNVQTLLTMLHRFGDFRTAEDLHLPVPALAERPDGQRAPAILTLPPTPELTRYLTTLGDRADAVALRSVRPEQDNLLKIASDGRKAALDLRLVQPGTPSGTTKIDAVADLIARVWTENKDNVYLDPATGEESPVRGALQLVFCDLGVPGDNWNVYDTLRGELHARGLPAGSVRYAHEARNDAEKGRLFAACRAGHVAVLIGSTSKMGVGTNVQARAIHLIDLDAPWRPADLEQRHGRILRQGNQNPEVAITQVVTGHSFDAYMWQTLEYKSKFITQVLSGKLTGIHEIDEIGSDTLSYAEVKALASGNPLLLDHAKATSELAKYQRLKSAHLANQRSLTGTLSLSGRDLANTRELIPVMDAAATAVVSTRADAFTAHIDQHRHTSRADAAHALGRLLRPGLARPATDFGAIAHLGGHTITAHHDGTTLHLEVPAAPAAIATVALNDLTGPLEPGFVVRLENLIRTIPDAAHRLHAREHELLDRIAAAQKALTLPFAHEQSLAKAETRYDQITRDLEAAAQQPAITTGAGPSPHSPQTPTTPEPTHHRPGAAAPAPPIWERVDNPTPTPFSPPTPPTRPTAPYR